MGRRVVYIWAVDGMSQIPEQDDSHGQTNPNQPDSTPEPGGRVPRLEYLNLKGRISGANGSDLILNASQEKKM